jgi:hypothetical protein
LTAAETAEKKAPEKNEAEKKVAEVEEKAAKKKAVEEKAAEKEAAEEKVADKQAAERSPVANPPETPETEDHASAKVHLVGTGEEDYKPKCLDFGEKSNYELSPRGNYVTQDRVRVIAGTHYWREGTVYGFSPGKGWVRVDLKPTGEEGEKMKVTLAPRTFKLAGDFRRNPKAEELAKCERERLAKAAKMMGEKSLDNMERHELQLIAMQIRKDTVFFLGRSFQQNRVSGLFEENRTG